MSSLWEQRAARNEALFREANEHIAHLEQQHGQAETAPVFLCECANADCTEQLPVPLETYGRIREEPRWFLVLAGHQDLQLERVIETHPDYLVVEKTGAAGDVAEQTQP